MANFTVLVLRRRSRSPRRIRWSAGRSRSLPMSAHRSPRKQQGQPFDASVDPDGATPPLFRGSWETPEFVTILRNALDWGLEPERPPPD